MDTEEINRQIHEKVMGEHRCSYGSYPHPSWEYWCSKCGHHSNDKSDGAVCSQKPPDYCSDLNLVRAAEMKVIEMVEKPSYYAAILAEVVKPDINLPAHVLFAVAMASAKERCLAILRAGRAE